jgi:hypothetical protein
VRVATALVAGQALLCAVIGWVTFGPPPEPGPRAAAPIEPLLTPPVVTPTVSLPAPAPASVAPEPASPTRSRSVRTKVSSRSPEAPRSPASPPAPTVGEAPPSLVIAPPQPDETRTPTPQPDGTRPGLIGTVAPAPTETVQGPVKAGERCAPEGARGVTADDRSLRCVLDDDGDLRWQIN